MANKKFWLGLLITALVFGTVVIGCDTGANTGSVGSDINYTVTANGTLDVEDTTQLTFTFSKPVNDLQDKDIALIADGKADKGNLTGSGTTWNLKITVKTAGEIKVQIPKIPGIKNDKKPVTIHKKGDITYTVTADGKVREETSTQLTFTFNAEVSDLEDEDITITNGTGTASKGTLTSDGASWNLEIIEIGAGTVEVQIDKPGIENKKKTVTLYQENVTPEITYTVTADGTPAEKTSTQLTFAFDAEVSGLQATDITITNGTGAASKGALTGSGANWKLEITDVEAGRVEVTIDKTGIESEEKIVMVHKAGDTPSDSTYTVTADGTVNAVTTTQLNFTFSAAVSSLKVENLIITKGTGAAEINSSIMNTLTGSGTSWTLSITKVTAGMIKVKIDKPGIESEEKTVTVHKNNAQGSDKEKAIKLSGRDWEYGSIAAGEAKWYKFDADAETDYLVQWKDKNSKPASEEYMAWIKVTAYESDGTTIISTINGADSYGFTDPKPVSEVTGTVYLKVEPYGASFAGTYAVRFYEPAGMPQVFITIESARATIVPFVAVKWYVNPLPGAKTDELNVSGFRVYRSTTQYGTYTKIGDYPITDFPLTSFTTYDSEKLIYIDKNAKVGYTYWYRVAAYNKDGVEGDMSDRIQSEVVPGTAPKALTIGAEKTESRMDTDVNEVVWYTFTAESSKTYKVQFESQYDNSVGWMKGGYAAIKVSVFTIDKELINFSEHYSNGESQGWGTPGTVSGVSSGKVYLKLELAEPFDYCFGKYTIKVSQE